MTPTKKKRPRRNICPSCDTPTGKASAKHTCPPAPFLQLTDRMKAQGVSARVRDTRVLCVKCALRTMVSNGTTRWCPSCDYA